METRIILTEDRIRGDLVKKISLKTGDKITIFGLFTCPFLLIAFFGLIFEAYILFAACLLLPILIVALILGNIARRKRAYLSMPITLCEEEITDILIGVLPPLRTMLFGSRYERRPRDYFVFSAHGRVEIPEGLAYLMKGEACYLVTDPCDKVVYLYPSRSHRPADGLTVK